ncbi:uncharacterized protein Z518_07655 [Rhinocladiella mackenziei CBS 650.93]|uniref:Protein kinase domain-containing protein n=1 Tax=Rhinocladiella mackenziei CBS 650.93 TaxID=1442369 RepID=A0A0D2FPI8_9EURO|nr:uncharacterized protein Z518_07655 [Rhinocladiella mackenziei CBS 650.93]KIX04102.1 hypothetical protein Z518_07655 [Rhinocladiella mackenziei CBS 650.93]
MGLSANKAPGRDTRQDRSLLSIPLDEETGLPRMYDARFARWLLDQVAGIASALALIHNMREEEPGEAPEKAIPGPAMGTWAPPSRLTESRATGYHRDIKLDNILVCESHKHEYGILKLGDFGSASIKELRRCKAYKFTTSQYAENPDGAETYDSPDRHIHGHTSRKTDLWALGCVFLELLLWCFDSEFTVDGFSDLRTKEKGFGEKSRSDKFWGKANAGSGYALKDCVQRKLEFLSEECRDRPKTPGRSLAAVYQADASH